MSDRNEKRILAGAMVLANCKTIGQFNDLPDFDVRFYLRKAEAVLAAATLANLRGCTPEEYEVATKGA